MKITDIDLTLIAWENIPKVKYGDHNPKIPGHSQLGLLRISIDDGIEGYSFLGSSFRGAQLDAVQLIEVLKPVLMGQNPLNRERLYRAMYQRIRAVSYRTIGAMDTALWDIAGKVAGLPIHQMLGTFRDSVPAYASSSTLDSEEAYIDEATQVKALGYKGYKIHPPSDIQKTAAICRSVRKAVGKDYKLMLDPGGIYSYEQALIVGEIIENLDFYWYEDPLATDDIYNCVKLRQKLKIPLMATEYSPGGFQSYAQWIILQATDYLRGDVAIKGGITPVIKTAHLAEAFHMNYEIHHGGNSINNVANLHVMLAIKNCEFFEVLLPNEAQQYGLLEDLQIDSNGCVHPMDGPGLGVQIDFDLIKRKTIQVLR